MEDLMEHRAHVKKAGLRATIGLFLFISSCSNPTVATQQDKNVNIQNYKTYRWISQEDAEYLSLRDPRTNQPVQAWVNVVKKPQTEQRVREVVEQDLNKQNYAPQTTGTPDFFVTFYSQARDKEWLSSWTGITLAFQNAPLVIYPNFDMHKALEFRPGTAYIVVYDAKTKRPAWTGEVIDAISPQGEVNAPVVTARIQELIAKFKNSV
jgi:hypothetical protein